MEQQTVSWVDHLGALLEASFSADCFICPTVVNAPDGLVTITVGAAHAFGVAQLLKQHPQVAMNYLRNVSGVDLETHIEVIYHLTNTTTLQHVCLKVHVPLETETMPSLTPLWETANWNEREIYDLLGVTFGGHPDLRRIMMSDEWVGHPLRKNYEPHDPEV